MVALYDQLDLRLVRFVGTDRIVLMRQPPRVTHATLKLD